MKKLSKSRRNIVYIKALKLLEERKKDYTPSTLVSYSLCVLLGFSFKRDTPLTYILPEFYLFKPEYNEDDQYWWSRWDFETRVNCLLFCIEMTKK